MKERTGRKTIYDCCVTEFSYRTNGFQGGDASHGGYLEITFKDAGSAAKGNDPLGFEDRPLMAQGG